MNVKILEKGVYKNFEYIICYVGSNFLKGWNSSYVKMKIPSKEILDKIDFCGGITFTGTYPTEDIRSQIGECIGWDYTYEPNKLERPIEDLKNDVKKVIDYIEEKTIKEISIKMLNSLSTGSKWIELHKDEFIKRILRVIWIKELAEIENINEINTEISYRMWATGFVEFIQETLKNDIRKEIENNKNS